MKAEKAVGKRQGEEGEELLRQLHGLLASWQEILDAVDLNVRSGLRELITSLNAGGAEGDQERFSAMIAQLRSLKIKPRKGRAKDVVRVVQLVQTLQSLYPAADERP